MKFMIRFIGCNMEAADKLEAFIMSNELGDYDRFHSTVGSDDFEVDIYTDSPIAVGLNSDKNILVLDKILEWGACITLEANSFYKMEVEIING